MHNKYCGRHDYKEMINKHYACAAIRVNNRCVFDDAKKNNNKKTGQ